MAITGYLKRQAPSAAAHIGKSFAKPPSLFKLTSWLFITYCSMVRERAEMPGYLAAKVGAEMAATTRANEGGWTAAIWCASFGLAIHPSFSLHGLSPLFEPETG